MNPAEEEIAFYFLVGKALAQWGHVEGQLRSLVIRSVSPIDGSSVGDAFLSIENFRSKLSFADNLIRKKYQHTEHVRAWSDLMNQIDARSQKRNLIAHGKSELMGVDKPGRRWAIVRWRNKGDKAQRSGALYLADIEVARAEFHALTTRIANFHEALSGRPPPFPASQEIPRNKSVAEIRKIVRRALHTAQDA